MKGVLQCVSMVILHTMLCFGHHLLAQEKPEALQAFPDSTHSSPRRYGLLVGCTVYPNLDEKKYWLNGPENDVLATKATLCDDRYGFKPQDIVCLTHNDPSMSLRPTSENIAREFEALCERVRRDDQVFILLAGHGSQLLNDNADEDPEPDGLDEVFVPEDVPAWDTSSPGFASSILRDDRIGAWLDRLREAGALVLLVADTCTSGSINRGAEEVASVVRWRKLPPLHTPEQAAALASINPNRELIAEEELDVPRGVACIFAVPAGFPAREDWMPPEGITGDMIIHGRLSYCLNTVLRAAQHPISVGELLTQISWKHAGWNWSPLPYSDATPDTLSRQVFGVARFPDRSRYELTQNQVGLQLNAGWLDQVLPGSIFAVYPPPGSENQDAISGYVRVISARSTTSSCEPCPFGNIEAAELQKLETPGRCELVYRELGDACLPVAVIGHSLRPPSKELLAQVSKTVGEVCSDRRNLVRAAESIETADVLVVVSEDTVAVRRRFDPETLPPSNEEQARALQYILPFPVDDKLAVQLRIRLHGISKAINLLRLAEEPDYVPRVRALQDRLLKLETTASLCRNGESEFTPLESHAQIKVFDGDRIRVHVHNLGDESVDVTGLLIETGFAIKSFSLRSLESPRIPVPHRIAPGDRTRFFEVKINDNTVGMEGMVLIAVPATDPVPRVFTEFQQESDKTFVRPDRAPARIHQLLESTLEGQVSRGAKRNEPQIDIRRISWNVSRKESGK